MAKHSKEASSTLYFTYSEFLKALEVRKKSLRILDNCNLKHEEQK